MVALFTGLLPIVLQVVSWFLGRSAASDEMKKKFLILVKQYESETGNAVKLADSARAQLELLKAELNGDITPKA
jgi:hypothetical protein